MPWILEKEFSFEASHQLPHHQGKCSRLHGHSWRGRLICKGDQLKTQGSETGMLVDYGAMKALIQPIIEQYLDHWHLNDTLQIESPTSEEVARWIFKKVKPSLPLLTRVVIEETCTSRCEYFE